MIELGAAVPGFLKNAFPEFLGESWRAWRTVFYVVFGRWDLVDEEGRALYEQCTGRTSPPVFLRELWEIVGRRGGKSRFMALVVVFIACVKRHTLAPGERGLVMLLAADRRQARVLKRYILALLEAVPTFKRLIVNVTADAIELSNGLTVEIHSSSFRAVRGYTIVAALCDEIAFWDTDEDAANPDTEVLNALRPAMATVPGALLLVLSSPYARRGELWTTFERHFGQADSDVLVWQADTRTMNPNVDERVIAAAYTADEASAAAEYGAEFRRDIEKYLSRELLMPVVVPGRLDLPYDTRHSYRAFVDPSGGSRDSFTMAIAHMEQQRAVLDRVFERRSPLSPAAVVGEFVAELRQFRIAAVTGDRYAGEWPREAFRKHGIEYRVAELNKSELYVGLLPIITSAQCELLDEPRLLAQLVALERRTARGGRDTVDHPPRGQDDVVNAAAGVLVASLKTGSGVAAGCARVEYLL